MHADPAGVLTGAHFLDGDHACCEGALAAGCRFVAGYPITPSTEVVERIAQRFPQVGGVFIQMEDELASSIAIAGAVWGGARAMTVTSGPGFSLMMEHIGLRGHDRDAVRVRQRAARRPVHGPADAARAGGHDAGALGIARRLRDHRASRPTRRRSASTSPSKAFNLAEQYRVPVLVMMDECVGHMMETVVIPTAEEIEIYPRQWTKTARRDEYLPYAAGRRPGARDGARGRGLPLPHDRA